ncbi:catalytic domain of components of various dehydrogenase complexes [Acidothermus cellulolyticus 11B]|uniref:Dihydrolipoamide acetyltransferase component of pyruvate dehydrogenase complex n=1 Tax=Acidothermus cellulolyticus (strain ATCC 43068 / DSM 8971 / 11B) TaxID=351607 RepID=A0LQU7_ACIC1|nr:dihydrolipoamide acetyltransferase family protein [Acidothermus cellulolyticus]ABK51807.1 catalytic domain of components of various dehydrogenase complexes [Acidothermus cellulolyticus 11B]
MIDIRYFRLPDVGEGLTEAEITRWHVRPGDRVGQNQVIAEIETAKALVELPSPFAGIVAEILVAEGTTVPVGTPIIGIDVAAAQSGAHPGVRETPNANDEADSAAMPRESAVIAATGSGTVPATGSGTAAATEKSTAMAPEKSSDMPDASGGTERTAVLVGYGPRTEGTPHRRRRRVGKPERPAEPVQAVAAAFHSQQPEHIAVPAIDTVEETADEPPPRAVTTSPVSTARDRSVLTEPILAKPPVRKLARDLHVDLRGVQGSGPGGVITREDVEAAARTTATAARTTAGATLGESLAAAATAPDATRPPIMRGEERIPVRGVRRETAAAMVRSAFTIPHVTEFVTIDVTPSMETLDRLRNRPEFAGIKLSPLTLTAKAVLLALRRYPLVNSYWDDASDEIVVRHYVNLGIATATPRGLVVPNIKDADRLSLIDLARAINELAATAREGRTPLAQLRNGTFTITNVGVFGVDTGTPIINPGEAAILALGTVRRAPWLYHDAVQPRWVTTLGLSFDHRIIDGDLGSRFLRDVAAFLEDPGAALLAAV